MISIADWEKKNRGGGGGGEVVETKATGFLAISF